MFKNKKFIWLAITAVVIVAIAIFMVSSVKNTGAAVSADTATVSNVSMSESIEASGQLEAQAYSTLIWNTSGTVDKVNVKVGDHVKAGDILLSLETTSAPANVISAQADLVTAKLALEDVLKSTLNLAQAEQDLADANEAVEDAEEDVTKLEYRRATDDVIKKIQAQIVLDNKAVSYAEDTYKSLRNRPEGDFVRAQALYDLSKARIDRDKDIANLNWYLGTPDSIDADKYRAALAVAQAEQADAQREVERLKDGPTADDIAAAQAAVDSAQATINYLYIIAPFDGEVLSIEQHPGDVVSIGSLAISFADRSKLHIDTKVDEADISQVKVGNPVSITMDTMPGMTLDGTVKFINPVGETISGLVKYTVRVELEPVSEPMLLGATAEVNIQVAEPQTALAVPATAIQSDSTGEYVFLIQTDGSTRRVEVQSGNSVGDLVVLTGDLQVGDQVQSNYEKGVQPSNPLSGK